MKVKENTKKKNETNNKKDALVMNLDDLICAGVCGEDRKDCYE